MNSNEKKVWDYLLLKKLPIDVLIEVQDHFMSQITDLQKKRNVVFESAFEEAKNIWKPEFKMIYNPSYSLDDISILNKKLIYNESVNTFKQSLLIGFVILLIIAIFSFIFTAEFFFYTFLLISVCIVLFPVIQLFVYRKKFKLIKKYDNYRLTFHQNFVNFSLVLLGGFVQFFMNIKAFSNVLYSSFHFLRIDLYDFISWPLYFALITINAYCFINQKKYLRQIGKVEPYLRYLKASS